MTVTPPARLRARPRPQALLAAAMVVLLVIAGTWSAAALRINLATFVDAVGAAMDFAERTVPLDFPPLGELLALCGTTLAIVICATVLASALSAPLALLAARNTTPFQSSRLPARAVIVLARAVPDVVLAVVFFRMFGIGGLTGVLAMGLHSVGMLGKVYADSVEQVDGGPRMAVRAAGGSRVQEVLSGVLPLVLPAWVAGALHRLDINLRVSVVLGFVGVGGLGKAIADALRTLDYQRGIALAAVVFVLCVVTEMVSGQLRRVLHGQSGAVRPVGATGRIGPPWNFARVRRVVYWVAATLVLLASVWGSGMSVDQLTRGVAEFGETIALFWPPETGGLLPELLGELWVTVRIALAATLIGAVVALPIGALAAENVAPNRTVARVFRGVVLAVRGVPELVLAIVFVVITGLGPVAGACALGVGTIGLLGKLVADALEEVDRGPQDALRATGAGRMQVFFAATLPQSLAACTAHVLYQLDTNLRSATLLGLVGAGGIGFYLLNATRVLEFGVVTTVLALMFAVTMVVELLALWLRRVLRG